jgi:DsbC/DsbD-like thiol-disulfide interchange protein
MVRLRHTWSFFLLAALIFALCSMVCTAIIVSTSTVLTASELPNASIRLINGGLIENVEYAGLEIKMDPGVKTYWRMPGDSGLPPIFDWSSSENLSEATIRWPLPERIADPAGTVLGYHERVVFPIQIKAKDSTKPIRLVLKLDYAICSDLCIPMSGKTELLLNSSTQNTLDTENVKRFLARVPITSTIGRPDLPSIMTIDPQSTDTLLLSTTQPITDLIIEGPNGWYFGDAAAQSSTRWTVKILERPTKAELAGLALTVTLISPEHATETSLILDASGSIR